MAMRFGAHDLLEAEANRMLRESLKGVTSFSEKKDILTPWKEGQAKRREVFVPSGTPDATVRRGMFKREANRGAPHLNARDGIGRPQRGLSTLEQFVEEHRDA